MPQMSPLLWLNLLSFFLFSFLCFIILNYFIFSPQNLPSQLNHVKE